VKLFTHKRGTSSRKHGSIHPLPIHLHGVVLKIVKHRDNFTFFMFKMDVSELDPLPSSDVSGGAAVRKSLSPSLGSEGNFSSGCNQVGPFLSPSSFRNVVCFKYTQDDGQCPTCVRRTDRGIYPWSGIFPSCQKSSKVQFCNIFVSCSKLQLPLQHIVCSVGSFLFSHE
jgi:hypothetical protein